MSTMHLNAFLNGHLTEEVYMAQPQGMRNANYPHHVCCLHKAIYELKQAPQAWYQALCNFLLRLTFVTSCAESSLFVYSHGSTLIYFLVYVDNLIITSSDPSLVNNIIRQLDSKFFTHLGCYLSSVALRFWPLRRVFYHLN